MKIVWTKHAEERQQEWEKRLGITKGEVEHALLVPEQVVVEEDVQIAQVKRGKGLLRVPFVEIGSTKRILTLYWTNQVNRYWREEQS